MHSFIHLFIHSSIHSFIHSFIHPFTHRLGCAFVHSIMQSFANAADELHISLFGLYVTFRFAYLKMRFSFRLVSRIIEPKDSCKQGFVFHCRYVVCLSLSGASGWMFSPSTSGKKIDDERKATLKYLSTFAKLKGPVSPRFVFKKQRFFPHNLM